MEKRAVKVRYDSDLDFLEVLLEQKEGYFEPVGDDGLMIRYDEDGNVIGFAIDGVTAVRPDGIDIELAQKGSPR
ncbi:MAG: DUF2283 domain-containing protein [Chloroflexi bacterium]|nr:DUF2283 domain-containing protein [Chloroflexota bacterium]